MKKFKTAVIGLGNIGFKFNLDPKRKETWSHVSAYEKCENTDLAGAVELNPENINIFKCHYPDIPVFKSVKDLMVSVDIDIVSICTPTESHYSILEELMAYPVKAVFCEKPFAASVADGEKMLHLCAKNNIILAVNHTRRWDYGYIIVRDIIHDGKIGAVKAVNALYPGQIFNIGTHLIDTVRMFIQRDAMMVSGISTNIDNPDPNISGWIDFEGAITFTMLSTGKREDIIFEIDVIGDEGRVRILENGDRVELYSFVESQRYSGYRELSLMPTVQLSRRDRMVEAVKDIVSVLKGNKINVSCTGRDGFLSLALSCDLIESARRNGNPVSLSYSEMMLDREQVSDEHIAY
ncbi:oxidoreductase domain protein [Candidatus Magnetobacterium bavaricum]|uniref:Oxidoreductase domain protein n=1 Tax=Candidatus Magnetobacterium bavaricum TaxID=29290 RepID=A0A0F3GHQ9_9BACT|nr:oxidoreductase domain protein [Candidatus Magnetobacterium bavaricum]